MTDLSPDVEALLNESYKSDLTEEESEELLLLCGHGIGPKLSSAADAVLDAYMNNCGWLDGPLEKDYRCAAAVLRAAADQVVPEEPYPNPSVQQPGGTHMYYREQLARWEERKLTRAELLAIAAELEGNNG